MAEAFALKWAFYESNPSFFLPLKARKAKRRVQLFFFLAGGYRKPPFTVNLRKESTKMIKRRFYRFEHGDRGAASSDSSSSSSSSEDSEVEQEQDPQSSSEEEVEDAADKLKGDDTQSSSGYESEDSLADEVHVNSSDLPVNEENATSGNRRQVIRDDQLSGKRGSELLEEQSIIRADSDSLPADIPDCIVKCKSAFKCRICPTIVCLNEETLRTHLKSKRHARSEKLLDEGRLKTVLNTSGKIEEDAPTLYAKILAHPQSMPRKNSNGQDKGSRKKRMRYGGKQTKRKAAKRRRKD